MPDLQDWREESLCFGQVELLIAFFPPMGLEMTLGTGCSTSKLMAVSRK